MERDKARLLTIRVLAEAETFAAGKGARNAVSYLQEVAESLMNKWWPKKQPSGERVTDAHIP